MLPHAFNAITSARRRLVAEKKGSTTSRLLAGTTANTGWFCSFRDLSGRTSSLALLNPEPLGVYRRFAAATAGAILDRKHRTPLFDRTRVEATVDDLQ